MPAWRSRAGDCSDGPDKNTGRSSNLDSVSTSSDPCPRCSVFQYTTTENISFPPFAALTPGHGPPTQAYWRVLDHPAHPLEDALLAPNSGTRRSTTARQ